MLMAKYVLTTVFLGLLTLLFYDPIPNNWEEFEHARKELTQEISTPIAANSKEESKQPVNHDEQYALVNATVNTKQP